jgi:hypothetical protein
LFCRFEKIFTKIVIKIEKSVGSLTFFRKMFPITVLMSLIVESSSPIFFYFDMIFIGELGHFVFVETLGTSYPVPKVPELGVTTFTFY